MTTHFDVLIIGAGLSGIGAAYHLQTRLPGKSYAILEGRDAIGGTWDLFRYPGIRSDSDMFTLGYRFRPWEQAKAIADGPSIREYVNDTAAQFEIDKRIRFNHWVSDLSWDTKSALWTVTASVDGETKKFTCNFLWNCAGYYRYAEGYTPDFPGRDTFKGQVIHPQNWPEDLDYAGKKVVVIGSGATAVTLIPSMAEDAGHITMLQRSPTFMFAMPGTSGLAKALHKVMPTSWAYNIMRWVRIIMQNVSYKLARARPDGARKQLIENARERLPETFDVETHFNPSYNPWEQRVCLVPDDDFYQAINRGKADIVTDHIETFTEGGIRLKSGKELEADIIVTATGLELEMLGGATLSVDGKEVNLGDTITYKGFMLSGVPNLASVFGYLNASWTLRADLISDFVCRLLSHMEKNGTEIATPVNNDPDMPLRPFADFSSGYITRAIDRLPKQGTGPWQHPQDFFVDMARLRHGKIDDGFLIFTRKYAKADAIDPHRDMEAA